MAANPNYSVSVSAEKAQSLKDYAGLVDLQVEDAGAGYRIRDCGTSARPQDERDLEGPWTIVCPADQEPKLRELLEKSPDFIE